MPQIYQASVTATEPLAPGVVQVTIAFDQPFHFAPGQYVSIHFGDGVSRAYCIASAPQRPQAVQLSVRIAGGAGSSAVSELAVGDRIEVEGPFGEFVLPEGERRDLVLVAGDTGIAPVRSIVLHLKVVEDPRKITVLYEPGGDGVVYGADFQNMGNAGSIRYRREKLDTAIQGESDALRDAFVMVAGFDSFLDRALRLLADAGVTRDRILAESFGRI